MLDAMIGFSRISPISVAQPWNSAREIVVPRAVSGWSASNCTIYLGSMNLGRICKATSNLA